MKTSIRLLMLAAAVCAVLSNATAADKAIIGGPKGGRLLDKTEPHAELVIEKDRSVTIHFYDARLKPVAATTQSVTVIADATKGRATVEFEKKGDSLVSKTRLPEGEGYNVIVQFKQTAEAKPMNIRFKLDLSTCGGCQRHEYACICGH
jgi:hypothetical protein